MVRLSSRRRLGLPYLRITEFQCSRTNLNTLSSSISAICLMATRLAIWTLSDLVERLLTYSSISRYARVNQPCTRTYIPSPLVVGDFITTHQYGVLFRVHSCTCV